MTWREIISDVVRRFRGSNITDPELNAELLAVHLLGGWKRTDLTPHLDSSVDDSIRAVYESMAIRRESGEPLQYITGETEFYGLRLWCDPSALIPRPDTETLVEVTIEKAAFLPNPRILEIGTGSGAAIIAVAKHLPSADCTAIDISGDALELARKNAARYALTNITFLHCDIRDDLSHLASFDIVISNPPYISNSEFTELDRDVREYEPRIALTDEGDGLTFYRIIAAKCRDGLLREGGHLIVEVGYDGAQRAADILQRAGFAEIETTKDHSSIERVVSAVVKDRSQM